MKRVAMEYSPECAIPYISRIDAGTIESVRKRGVDVLSSGDLVQRFEAVWDEQALATHREASAALYRIKDRAFEAVAQQMRDGVRHDRVRHPAADGRLVRGRRAGQRLGSSGGGAGKCGQPALPADRGARAAPIGQDELVLLDLWGKKKDDPAAVYADITWVGFTGPRGAGRDGSGVRGGGGGAGRGAAAGAGIGPATSGTCAAGRWIAPPGRCWRRRDIGEQILHRTGHNLGRDVHGNGVHMDDYESHDDRRLLPGTGFTIEPGLYFRSFGVRSEINVFYGEHEALITGPVQTEILRLVSRRDRASGGLVCLGLFHLLEKRRLFTSP